MRYLNIGVICCSASKDGRGSKSWSKPMSKRYAVVSRRGRRVRSVFVDLSRRVRRQFVVWKRVGGHVWVCSDDDDDDAGEVDEDGNKGIAERMSWRALRAV